MAPPATPPPPPPASPPAPAPRGTDLYPSTSPGSAIDGDQQLRDELSYLRRLGRALVGDRADAADVAQATYLRAATHRTG